MVAAPPLTKGTYAKGQGEAIEKSPLLGCLGVLKRALTQKIRANKLQVSRRK